MALRSRVSAFLVSLARFSADRPLTTIALSLLLCAACVWKIDALTIDTTTEGLLFENDPSLVIYNDFLDRYGRDERIIVALKADDIFVSRAIEKIARIQTAIEEQVPYLTKVDSIVSARDTRGEGDSLIVGELFDRYPTNADEWQAIKARAMRNPFYTDLLVSKDATIAAIVIRTLSRVSVAAQDGFDEMGDLWFGKSSETMPLSDEQNSEIVTAIYKIVNAEQSAEMPLYIAGSPVVTDQLKRAMIADISHFVKLLILMIAAVLFLFFRRLSGVIYPLIVVILSLVSMLGLMAICGVPIKIPTQIAPTFLLAVGVGATVHLLTIYYREFQNSGDRKEAVFYAASHTAPAIVMTALTTIAGVGSFVFAKIEPFADLGRFTAFGILMSLILTLTLLPALLAITPIKLRAKRDTFVSADRLLKWFATLSWRFPKTIVFCFAVLLTVSIALLSEVRLSHYIVGWFPKTSAVRIATDLLDEKMHGSVTIEVLIDTKMSDALYDPQLMNRIDESAQGATEIEPIKKVVSIATIVKEINRALNENDDRYYTIPESKGAIAESLLLFSNSSDDLTEVTNSDYSQVRITHKIPFPDAVDGQKIIDKLSKFYEKAFPNSDIKMTGLVTLLCTVLSASVESMAVSYTLSIFMITAMMIATFGSIRLGLFSMIPNLTPIIIGMALMVVLGIAFDMFVMLVGSIVLGLVVDDTIHFIHNFRRSYLKTHDIIVSLEETMLGTGRALVITSVVLALGFGVYLFAEMQNIVGFGIIASACIVLALLADLLLTPALFILWFRSGKCVI
ncbi:membrane protein [Campylobacterota bacterium]|nr:membrane protein [Campylobacterota bacterium]